MLDSALCRAVDDSSFKSEVLEADLPVLVDFGAKWCAPCRALDPVVARLAAETQGKLKVVTIDTEEAPATAQAYGIRSVPTLLLFRHGGATIRHIGVVSKEKLLALIEGS